MMGGMIPLDKNESYWLLDGPLLEVARAAVGARALGTYPAYDELTDDIARYAGVPCEQVLVTPGSDAAIEHIARMYAGAGRTALLPVPAFYGYESILARAGAEVAIVPYELAERSFIFPLERTLALLAEGPGALFLCQPNNPLGSAIPDEAMTRMCEAACERETVLVSDEAYYEFSGRTLLTRLADMPNLIILRTFSKGFGFPGGRVGYVIAAPAIIERLRAELLPWPVAHPSVVVARALLAQEPAVAARRQTIIAEREQFMGELAQLKDVAVYPSETNFVLMRVPDAVRMQRALAEEGILVARGEPMTRFPEAQALLMNTLRLAVPAPVDQPAVMGAITRCLQE